MNKKKTKSIDSRLKKLLLVCFIPIVIVVIYFLSMARSISDRYERIVSNITAVNEYNITFKEDLDYIMYIVTVNADRAHVLVDVDQPHRMISSARETLTNLMNDTPVSDRRRMLEGIIRNLDTLERHVTEIEENANVVGQYDRNMNCLELDIRILTELIQEDIQTYISTEVNRLHTLQTKLKKEIGFTIIGGIIVSILVIAVAVALSSRIQKSITAGIWEIQSLTRRAGRGDFSSRVSVDSMDAELADLGVGYNQMVEKLDTLVQNIKDDQVALRMTEQKLLQAQINPHFLYNTLDNIVWLAEAGDKEHVIMMVTALSDFFRTTLSKGRDSITIQEEESHIRSYLQIQQFRYQDILEYEINIPEELYPYQILKLTLQPLVENALYHGIKNKRGKGYIKVSGRKEGEKIYLTVQDNGIGMKPERLQQVIYRMYHETEKRTSFGLYNVVQRIQLNYGPEYDVEIQSTYGEGTSITVCLPATRDIV